MYGYLTFYFKVKINNENHYIYEAVSPKGKIEEIKFCSKEEYIKNTTDMNNTSNEDKILVEKTNEN